MKIVTVVALIALAETVSGCNFTNCKTRLEGLRKWAKDEYFPVFVDSVIAKYNDFYDEDGKPWPNTTSITFKTSKEARLKSIKEQLDRLAPVDDLVCDSASDNFGLPDLGWYPNLALCAILDRKFPSDFTDEAMVDEIQDLLQFALDQLNTGWVARFAHLTVIGYQNFDGRVGFDLVNTGDAYLGLIEQWGAPAAVVNKAKEMGDKMKARLTNWKPSEFYNRMHSCRFTHQTTIVTLLTVARGQYVYRLGMFEVVNGNEFDPLEDLAPGDFHTFRIKAGFQNGNWYKFVTWTRPVVKQDALILVSPFADHIKFQGFDIMVHRIECGNYVLFVEERIEMDWRERLFPCNKFILEKYYAQLKDVVQAEEISQNQNFRMHADSTEVQKYVAGPVGVLKKLVTDKLVVMQAHVDGVNSTIDVVMANVTGEVEFVGVPLEALKRVVQDPPNKDSILKSVSRTALFGAAPFVVGVAQFGSLKLTGFVQGGGPLLHDDQDWRLAVKNARVLLPPFDCTNKRNAREALSCISAGGKQVFEFLKPDTNYSFFTDENLCEAQVKAYKEEGVAGYSITGLRSVTG